MNKLIRLELARIKATNKLNEELKKAWPEGSEIMFTIRYGQKIPSKGIVIAHYAPCLKVRLLTIKGKVTDVHYRKVI